MMEIKKKKKMLQQQINITNKLAVFLWLLRKKLKSQTRSMQRYDAI